MKPYTYFGAENYNCDAYGQYAFGECAPQNSTPSGGLSYTGDLIMLPLALAGAIIIASAILLVKKIRRNKLQSENS